MPPDQPDESIQPEPIEQVRPLPDAWPPPFMVLVLTLIAIIIAVILGGVITHVLGMVFHYDLIQIMDTIETDNTRFHRDILRGSNLISHLLAFSGASLAVMLFVYRKEWASRLTLTYFPGWGKIAAAAGMMLFALPWVQLTYWLNQQIPLPGWLADMENQTSGIIQAILVMESPWELALSLIVIALAPAIGEELLFRGIVQTQIARLWNKPVAAVWVTAVLFSIIHFQFAGFVPRMLLGAGLGYLMLWTRSLWAPIAGHFAINAIQVIAQYVAKTDLTQAEKELDINQLLIPCALTLPVLVIFIKYFISKNKISASQ